MLSTFKELLKGALANNIQDVSVDLEPKSKPRRIVFQIAFKDNGKLKYTLGKEAETPPPPSTMPLKNRGTRKRT